MWKQKLGLGILSLPGMTVADEIRAMRKVGFEAFFTGWKAGDPVEEWATVATECGMIYQSIHAPFGRAADIWGADEEKGEAAVPRALRLSGRLQAGGCAHHGDSRLHRLPRSLPYRGGACPF